MSESDIIRNGGNAWVWESSQNTVNHLVIPARAEGVYQLVIKGVIITLAVWFDVLQKKR